MPITDNDRRGLQRDGTNTSEYNRLNFATEQQIRNSVNTAWIGRVDAVSTEDEPTASGTVDATQMVAQSDAEGQSLPMASVPALPYVRLQCGIAALIINPVPGDLFLFDTCKRDSSTVKQGTGEPQRAGSYRQFDVSDSVAVGAVHTKPPEVWIHIKQDKTVMIHAPEGVTIETDSKVTITAPGGVGITAPTVTMSGNLQVAGTITAGGDVKGGSISLQGHTHPGVDRGNSNTDPPQ